MDFVLRTGDQAIFDPVFGAATVVAPPGIITGSSRGKNDGATICVQGDEATVVVVGATYSAGPFAGGTGTLTIESLASDQIAAESSSTKRPTLLRGSRFRARLSVTSAAKNPSGTPADDPVRVYSGTGAFVAANTKVRSG